MVILIHILYAFNYNFLRNQILLIRRSSFTSWNNHSLTSTKLFITKNDTLDSYVKEKKSKSQHFFLLRPYSTFVSYPITKQ